LVNKEDVMTTSDEVIKQIKKQKHKVKEYVENNGYFSIMNNTKWKELINDIHDLKFPPAYCVKDILANNNPQMISKPTYWGDWALELLYPCFWIEWMEIAPYYYKHRGKLIEDELIDETKEVLEILERNNIPYELNGKNILIYGYKK